MAGVALLLTATLTVGCVGLTKPKVVEECAAANTCSNDPSQQPGRDANQDIQQPDPDLQSRDNQPDKDDVGPDSLGPDAPADHAAQGGDTQDISGTDAKETGTSSDADSGPAPDDARTDLAPDTNRQDRGPDLVPDSRPDLAPDLFPDLGPDLGRDLGPDTSPDGSTLSSGLLVYYKCESATGTTLQDSSGNGNHGTLLGGTAGYSFPTGKVGKALALAKAGPGYVSVPTAVFANAKVITIATWINVTTSQSWARVFDVGVNAKIASNTSSGTKYMNLVPKNAGTSLAFAISKDGYGSEQTLTSAALDTGKWRHVVVVLGAGQSSLYVDGAVVPNTSAISVFPADLGTIDYAYLGKSQFSSDPNFDGQIDEFRVYGRALSAAEIQELYQFAGP
jgi:hypothetical protein